MATAAQFSVDVTGTGVLTSIPDNDIARLMYYLHCITVGVGMDILEDDLVDYRNYYRLTRNRIALVIKYALLLSPDELIGKLIFLDEDGDITGSSGNEFCKISVACNIVSLQRTALIAGKMQNITEVMFFKASWLNNYYIRPITRIHERPVVRREKSPDCIIA